MNVNDYVVYKYPEKNKATAKIEGLEYLAKLEAGQTYKVVSIDYLHHPHIKHGKIVCIKLNKPDHHYNIWVSFESLHNPDDLNLPDWF